MTMPFTLPPGTTIQSPLRIMSFCDSCTPATKPRMLSLNTSISTAAKAPSPVMSAMGDRSMRIETDTITQKPVNSPRII